MSEKEKLRNRALEVSLCETCHYGHIQRSYAESQETAFCSRHDRLRPLRFRVRECSDYSDRRLPSLYCMEKVAYVLVEERPNRKAGFVTVRQFLEMEGEDAEIVPSSRLKRGR